MKTRKNAAVIATGHRFFSEDGMIMSIDLGCLVSDQHLKCPDLYLR
jgi:hypothetical protein